VLLGIRPRFKRKYDRLVLEDRSPLVNAYGAQQTVVKDRYRCVFVVNACQEKEVVNSYFGVCGQFIEETLGGHRRRLREGFFFLSLFLFRRLRHPVIVTVTTFGYAEINRRDVGLFSNKGVIIFRRTTQKIHWRNFSPKCETN